MVVLYTNKEMQDVLRELRIKPVHGLVNTKEAARILTWRAKAEYDVEHAYPESAVRRHVETGNLTIAQKASATANLYKVEDVFDIPITPRRGIAQKKEAA